MKLFTECGVRKDSRGNFIFDDRYTSLKDLIDLCHREFPGVYLEEIYFPSPNGFYPEHLEYYDMVIGRWPSPNLEQSYFAKENHHCIQLSHALTLAMAVSTARHVPNCDLSKCFMGWLKGQFFVTVRT